MVGHESDLRCSQRSLLRRDWHFNAHGVSHISRISASLFDRLICRRDLPESLLSEIKVKDAVREQTSLRLLSEKEKFV
jgi:hypothetical protein